VALIHFNSGSVRHRALLTINSFPSAVQTENAAIQFSAVQFQDVIAAALNVPTANIPEIQIVLILTLGMACKTPTDLSAAAQSQILSLVSASSTGIFTVVVVSSSVDLGGNICPPVGSRRRDSGNQATGTFDVLVVPPVRLQVHFGFLHVC
jgi:hypothetical protein